MKLSFFRRSIFIMSVLTLFLFPQWAISQQIINVKHSAYTNKEATTEKEIKQLIKQISISHPLFIEWQEASWQSKSLFTDKSLQVVFLSANGKDVGYILLSTENKKKQFQVLEYGRLDEAKLLHKIVDEITLSGAKGDYLFPELLWVKRDEQGYLDLLSGERYEDIEHVSLLRPSGKALDQFIASYTPTIHSDPITFLDRTKEKQAGQLGLDGEWLKTETLPSLYESQVLPGITGLYPIMDIHQWQSNNKTVLFIGLEDYGIRFLSLEYLNSRGRFE